MSRSSAAAVSSTRIGKAEKWKILHTYKTEHRKPTTQIPKNIPSQQDDGQPRIFNINTMDNDAL